MFWDPAPRRYPFLIPGQIFVWNLFVAHFFVRISSSAFLRLRISLSCISLSRISLYAQFLVLHFFISAKIRLHSYSYRKYPSTQIFVHISLSANLRPQIFVRISLSANLRPHFFICISLSANPCPQIFAFLRPQMFVRISSSPNILQTKCGQRFADEDLQTKICGQRFAQTNICDMNNCRDEFLRRQRNAIRIIAHTKNCAYQEMRRRRFADKEMLMKKCATKKCQTKICLDTLLDANRIDIHWSS